MQFKIEKNIPIPPGTRGSEARNKYPFRELGVGNSFFMEEPDAKTRKRLQQRLSSYGRNRLPAKKFVTRQMDGGVRVWRIV